MAEREEGGAGQDQRDHAVDGAAAQQAVAERLPGRACPEAAEQDSAPTTPIAAASVAVAKPG